MAEKYVADGYAQTGYVEGDTPSIDSPVTECDLTQVLSELSALKTMVTQLTSQIQTQNTTLLAVNNKVLNLQADIADLKASQITLEQYKATVPQVTDESIFAYENGTTVAFKTVPDVPFEVRASRFVNVEGKAYLFELYYELQLPDTDRISLIAASALMRYVGDSGGA